MANSIKQFANVPQTQPAQQVAPAQMPEAAPINNPMQMIQQLNSLRSQFSNPQQAQQAVMQMLQNGQISNAQLNMAMQQAQQMMPMLQQMGLFGRR